ncbi:MAG: T9SS type A sorting domain-containing protein [Owenweeksia sp.]|nr:T9SS type A sorting domain-containing protein [Owenweeksia sp.]
MEIYPNPTKNRLYFKFPDDYPSEVSVKIMDVNGKLVYDKTHHLNEPALRIKLDKLRSEYVIVSVGDYQEKIWLTR